MLEVSKGDVYARRRPKRGPTWREVLLVRDDRVIYATPRGTKGSCSLKTFIRWADGHNRFTPKAGPLL